MSFFQPRLEAAKALLTTAGLPTDDLPEQLEHFLACGNAAEPDGIVGLEIFGEDALLRSLVVAEGMRERGLGKDLVAAAEALATSEGVRRVFLLTDTAAGFFSALGYTSSDRGLAPAPVRASRQFSELCPATAAFMVKNLNR